MRDGHFQTREYHTADTKHTAMIASDRFNPGDVFRNMGRSTVDHGAGCSWRPGRLIG